MKPLTQRAKSAPTPPAPRGVRADAQRNIDALLQAAKDVFATSGVDAPVREVATRAGVGVGTVYRHFPQRADLIAAVFRREVDACAAAAPALARKHQPDEALSKWIWRYTSFIAAKRGLASALHSGDPAFDALPAYFEQQLAPALESLLEEAVTAGTIRGDVQPYDLLRAVANLCQTSRADGAEHSKRMIALLIDGLRYGAASSPSVASTPRRRRK